MNIFTVFCILILVNGSNFLDGLNTLVIGYYFLVCSFLILLTNNFDLEINININLLLIFLLITYFFNFFEKIYLGDSGSYLIGFYISYFVIDFILINTVVSPYLICFLLWYPAFENLFSILRRILATKKNNIQNNILVNLKNKNTNQLEETNVNEKTIANLNHDLTKKTLKKPIKKRVIKKVQEVLDKKNEVIDQKKPKKNNEKSPSENKPSKSGWWSRKI